MIFDHRTLDQITNDEIAALVTTKASERQNLEFKATIKMSGDDVSDKLEMLKDVASMANGGGGYLIVGIEDKGSGKAIRFCPELVGDVAKISNAVRELCWKHIDPPIQDLQIESRNIQNNQVVIVRIPFSGGRPHMVKFNEGTHFLSRYGDGKKSMSLPEIRASFTDDVFGQRLSRIESTIPQILHELRRLLPSESHPLKTDQALKDEITLTDKVTLTLIKDGKNFSEESEQAFEKSVASSPYLRLSINPIQLVPSKLDVDSQVVQDLLRNPPASRQHGWNMEHWGEPVVRVSYGVERGNFSYEYLKLLETGYMEFVTPLDEHFCWRQSLEEIAKNPRLWPYPVVEYPVTFLKLYEEIAKSLSGPFIFRLQFRNIAGYRLPPYQPDAYGFILGQGEVKPFPQQHLVKVMELKDGFNADSVAYEMLKSVYSAFGHAADKIPFWKGDRFEFPAA